MKIKFIMKFTTYNVKYTHILLLLIKYLLLDYEIVHCFLASTYPIIILYNTRYFVKSERCYKYKNIF